MNKHHNFRKSGIANLQHCWVLMLTQSTK